MKIGIAGPVALNLLDIDFKGVVLPETFSFPITSHLINGLLERKHEIVIYTTAYKTSPITEPVVLELDRVTICIAPYKTHPGRDFFKAVRLELVQLMKKYPADIINAHWSYEYAWAALDTKMPTVVTLRDHATTVLKYQFIPFRMVRWIMNYISLSRAKHLSTNSDYLFHLLSKAEQKKATVINNFYSKNLESYFCRSEKKSDCIVSVNNGFDKRKNVESGLLAFREIRKKFPYLKYYLIGGEMEPEGAAHQFAKQNNLTEGVVFMGYKPFKEVIQVIASAKLLVHTSREESFGNTVLEAMIVGTPVIGGSKSGNIPFLLGQGKYGVLCDITSADEINKAAQKILSNSDFADSLIVEANKYAKTCFSQEVIVEDYIHLYRKVLQIDSPELYSLDEDYFVAAE